MKRKPAVLSILLALTCMVGCASVKQTGPFCLVNPAVKAFMDGVSYPDDDYSWSAVPDYCRQRFYRTDWPLPAVIDLPDLTGMPEAYALVDVDADLAPQTAWCFNLSPDSRALKVYNLLPGRTYHYAVMGLSRDGAEIALKTGTFDTSDDPTRMLRIDGIQNVRDVGGYLTADGRRVKYGLILRGGTTDDSVFQEYSITDEGLQALVTRLGVRAELDLRGDRARTLGTGVSFKSIPYFPYTEAVESRQARDSLKAIFEYLLKCLDRERPVYIHCKGGADRTGTLVFLLLGALGVDESTCVKEYELTSFSPVGRQTRRRDSGEFDFRGMVAAIKAYPGQTLAAQIESFLVECGISVEDIGRFRQMMLE